MPSTLDPDQLVDSLVPVIDDLRDLGRTFGIRQYRLHTLIRTWSGDEVGDGTSSDSVPIEILPRPLIKPMRWLHNRLEPCGLIEAGYCDIEEVSLAYSFADLHGPTLTVKQRWLLSVSEGYGQGQPTRYFVHDRPPYADREKTIAWMLWLKAVQL